MKSPTTTTTPSSSLSLGTKKIQEIALREQQKEKKARLEAILIQKLEVIHGKRSSKPLSKRDITYMVKQFLESYPEKKQQKLLASDKSTINCRKSMLDGLVKDISSNVDKLLVSSQMKSGSKANKTKKELRFVDSADHDDSTKSISTRKSSMKCNTHHNDCNNNTSAKQKSNLENINPWTLLESYQSVRTQEHIVSQKEKGLIDREENKKRLNDQIKEKEAQKLRQKKEDENFIKKQQMEQLKWQEEQKKKEKKEREKTLYLKNIRQEQIALHEEKQKKEKLKERQKELEDIAKTKEQLEKEEEDKIEKKKMEQVRWEQMKQESKERAKTREEEKKKEALMDAKFIADLEQKYHIEEARKQEQLNERLEKARRMENNVVQLDELKKAKELQKKIEMKVLRDANAKDKADMQKEKKKKEMRQLQMKQITEANKAMADEMLRKKEIEAQEEKERHLKFYRETEKIMLAEEEEQRLKKASSQKKYCGLLEKQIEYRSELEKNNSDMTNVEKSINRKTLQRIQNDPVLKEKILAQLEKKKSVVEVDPSCE